jgi:hypothetical protein
LIELFDQVRHKTPGFQNASCPAACRAQPGCRPEPNWVSRIRFT